MNFVKGYFNNLSGFVTNLLDDPKPKSTGVSPDSVENVPRSEDFVTASPDRSEQSSFKLLDWIPKLTSPAENAVVYYMNALATLGSTQPEESATDVEREISESSVIVDSPKVETPIEPPTESATSDASKDEEETVCTDWMSELSSRTEEVWKQVKQDIQEIVTVISTEPKDAVARTASSVRQHLSAVADAAKHMDPSQFSLLPESKESEIADTTSDTLVEGTGPPKSADPPSLSDLRSDLSHFFSGVVNALFKPEESAQPPLRDRREARLRILRADPATYEQVPSPPPAHLGLPNYTDWRSAYFDEVTCQPLPGVPLGSARDASNAHQDADQVLALQPPSPEQLLEENPFMRKYLSQLVRVEGQANEQGITDADFWSRYYYRVWLLDVTERRRQRLVELVESKTRTSGQSATGENGHKGVEADSDSSDWFSHSDTEAARPETATSSAQPSSTESSLEQTSTTTSRPETETSPVESHKRLGRQRKRRVRKRTEGDQHGSSYQSDSCSEPHDRPLESEFGSVSIKRETATVMEPANIQKTTNVDPVPEVKVDNSVLTEPTDDVATSGSSSLVVLSNSDDERDFDATLVGPRARSFAASATTTTTGICQSSLVAARLSHGHQRNISEPNSDDWDDLCGSDGPQLPLPRPTPIREATKADSDQVLDAWDSWS